MELNYPLDLRHLARTFPWRLFHKRMDEDFLVRQVCVCACKMCVALSLDSGKRLSAHQIYDILSQHFRGDCFTMDKYKSTCLSPQLTHVTCFGSFCTTERMGGVWCWLMRPTLLLECDKAIAICCTRRHIILQSENIQVRDLFSSCFSRFTPFPIGSIREGVLIRIRYEPKDVLPWHPYARGRRREGYELAIDTKKRCLFPCPVLV